MNRQIVVFVVFISAFICDVSWSEPSFTNLVNCYTALSVANVTVDPKREPPASKIVDVDGGHKWGGYIFTPNMAYLCSLPTPKIPFAGNPRLGIECFHFNLQYGSSEYELNIVDQNPVGGKMISAGTFSGECERPSSGGDKGIETVSCHEALDKNARHRLIEKIKNFPKMDDNIQGAYIVCKKLIPELSDVFDKRIKEWDQIRSNYPVPRPHSIALRFVRYSAAGEALRLKTGCEAYYH